VELHNINDPNDCLRSIARVQGRWHHLLCCQALVLHHHLQQPSKASIMQ
jgi:hypothetical protein